MVAESDEATLGHLAPQARQPQRGCAYQDRRNHVVVVDATSIGTQCSSYLATLGWRTESHWDSRMKEPQRPLSLCICLRLKNLSVFWEFKNFVSHPAKTSPVRDGRSIPLILATDCGHLGTVKKNAPIPELFIFFSVEKMKAGV